MSSTNIHPTFDRIFPRKEKEKLLNQKSVVIWFTGLSGSGKTTLAVELEKQLFKEGYFIQILDGDNIRSGINKNLGFSQQDREENIRRIAEISKLFLNAGVITINCFVSPTENLRTMAKEIIGADNFIEVFIDAPLETCEHRDVKGLYNKARNGEINDFTGIQEKFEVPFQPNLVVKTEKNSVEVCVQEIMNYIKPRIKF